MNEKTIIKCSLCIAHCPIGEMQSFMVVNGHTPIFLCSECWETIINRMRYMAHREKYSVIQLRLFSLGKDCDFVCDGGATQNGQAVIAYPTREEAVGRYILEHADLLGIKIEETCHASKF